jgi:hypothetical protein
LIFESFRVKRKTDAQEDLMPEKPYDKELMIFKEMTMSNSVMVDVLTRLLFDKGVFTEEEFIRRLKEVQDEYDSQDRQ